MAHLPNSPIVLSLTVNDVAAALDFYVKAFGAKETSRMPLPDGTVVQGDFQIGTSMFYVSLGSEDWKAASLPADGLSSCLFIVEVEDPQESFDLAVSEGATAIEEPKDQFWGMRTAILADPFGYRWNLRKILEVLTPEQMMERAQEAMKGN